MRVYEIGSVLGGAIMISVMCFCVEAVLAPTDLERCAASCGQGRFKTYTGEVLVPGGSNIPEKCECSVQVECHKGANGDCVRHVSEGER